MGIQDHSMARTHNGDLIVVGGFLNPTTGFEVERGHSNMLYRLVCQDRVCQWEEMQQNLEFGRRNSVALVVPNDFCKLTTTHP